MSSHVVGTLFMKSIAHAGASVRLLGARAKCCTGLWNNTAVARANTSDVTRRLPLVGFVLIVVELVERAAAEVHAAHSVAE